MKNLIQYAVPLRKVPKKLKGQDKMIAFVCDEKIFFCYNNKYYGTCNFLTVHEILKKNNYKIQ